MQSNCSETRDLLMQQKYFRKGGFYLNSFVLLTFIEKKSTHFHLYTWQKSVFEQRKSVILHFNRLATPLNLPKKAISIFPFKMEDDPWIIPYMCTETYRTLPCHTFTFCRSHIFNKWYIDPVTGNPQSFCEDS